MTSGTVVGEMSRHKQVESSGDSTAPVVFADIRPLLDSLEPRVAIVMAAYNGGRFIEEQIKSIQAQTYAAWTLYVRDDGSRDDTIQKVSQIAHEDRRVQQVHDELGTLGAIGNFSALMQVALQGGAGYVFFADQDDIWHREKVVTMLGAMQALEAANGTSTPLLVHCDLAVVNEELRPTASSFAQYSRLSPTTAGLGTLLCQNQVTGCACVINRSLLKLACPVPSGVLMHDWWLALLAASVGKVAFIPKPLVMYRQHGGNVLGAVSLGRRIWELLFSPRQWALRIIVIKRGFMQAELLKERIQARQDELPPTILKQIDTYSRILEIAPFQRVGVLRAKGIGRPASSSGLLFNLLITVMEWKREDL